MIGEAPFDLCRRRDRRRGRVHPADRAPERDRPARDRRRGRPPAPCSSSTTAGGAGRRPALRRRPTAPSRCSSPHYYIIRALQPFADIREPRDANVATADARADRQRRLGRSSWPTSARCRPTTRKRLGAWVEAGGTLVRFAGPRLATAEPTRWCRSRSGRATASSAARCPGRRRSRSASFSANEPVRRPDSPRATSWSSARSSPSRTPAWPSVPGRPSPTARRWSPPRRRGEGWLVLFHVTADTSWSNLPLSGVFVEMLRRIIGLLERVGAARPSPARRRAGPPYRILDGFGRFGAAGTASRADRRRRDRRSPVNAEHPPGLYGNEDGFRSLNLLARQRGARARFDARALGMPMCARIPTAAPLELRPWLLARGARSACPRRARGPLACGGAFRSRRRAAAAGLALLTLVVGAAPRPGHSARPTARPTDPADDDARSASPTHCSPMSITGNAEIDEVSRAGLSGLSPILDRAHRPRAGRPDRRRSRHATSLSFFPLLYWPIDPGAPMPSSATMARIDTYMRQGGTVLFDTRDQLERSTHASTASAARRRASASGRCWRASTSRRSSRCRPTTCSPRPSISSTISPAATPAARSGSRLAPSRPRTAPTARSAPATACRPILITANDFAAAWAIDEHRRASSTRPCRADPRSARWPFRVGINIVMYTLTGNYKADQVHVPALLERLGQ